MPVSISFTADLEILLIKRSLGSWGKRILGRNAHLYVLAIELSLMSIRVPQGP